MYLLYPDNFLVRQVAKPTEWQQWSTVAIEAVNIVKLFQTATTVPIATIGRR